HDAASAYTSSASITLTAADTGGSGLKEIRYTLDGGSEVVVSGSPATVTTSDVGSHTLAARSYDHAGNASDQLSVEFTVYAPATISEIQSPTHASDTAWHDSRSPVEFTWTGTPAVGYSYVFDKVSGTVPDQVQDTASPSASVSADSDGEWWFHVRGVNGAGAWGPAQHRRVRIDATPPTLVSDAQASYEDWAVFTLTAEDTGGSGVKEIRYTLDGGSQVVVAGGTAPVSTLEIGPHTLTARSYDNAGNASAELVVHFEVIVGEVPRVVGLTSSTHPVPSTWYPSRDVSFSWNGVGGATRYSYVFDKNASTEWGDDTETSDTSADVTADSDGVWYFHIKAGNGTVWVETQPMMVRIDATKPTLSHNAKTSYTGSASITLTASDTGGSEVKEIRYRLDGDPEVPVPGSSATVSTSLLGSHTLTARSYDNAGNASDAETISFTVGTAYVRVEGSDRFGTAVAVSKKAFATAETVVIATGYNWPDALGGAALAKAYDGPILLVKPNEVPKVVMDEIVRLRAKNAIILGSANAVSSGVENALKAKLGSTKVTRLGGRDRYETANMVAAATVKRLGGAYDGKAFVATGGNFPDALAASPLAAAKGWPIYLTKDTGLPSNVRSAMKAAKVTKPIILGSTAAVPRVVENDLKAAFGTGNVSRLFGDNRYATAVKVAAYGVAQAGLHWDRLAIGTGENFPDALAGGVLQGKHGSVMLLTPGKALDPGVKNLLAAKKAEIREVRYLGSDNAVSLAVRNAVKAILYK
ncbi:MAG: cell wall-binding repeat-containing protein, partial [Coriobacteriia bacterium]|nr:cell wall-binding repeat-containing protein [Coriobacteriia bacterium]